MCEMKALSCASIMYRENRLFVQHLKSSCSCLDLVQCRRTLSFKSPSKIREWPETKLGPIGTVSARCPLPGLVGVHASPTRKFEDIVPEGSKKVLLSMPLSPESHYISILLNAQHHAEETLLGLIPIKLPKSTLTCEVQECPHILSEQLIPLFSGRELSKVKLTVVSLTQDTGMFTSKLNDELITERERLANDFITFAIDLCASLKEVGFWADFINPHNGFAYINPHIEARGDSEIKPFTEADSRMEYLGFTVDDMGCCKILRHAQFGSNIQVDLIFTNAPSNHPLLEKLLQFTSTSSTGANGTEDHPLPPRVDFTPNPFNTIDSTPPSSGEPKLTLDFYLKKPPNESGGATSD